jgi:hypothetical protein
VRQAITEWNSVNGTKLTFREVSSNGHIIVWAAGLAMDVAGQADLPTSSMPGRNVMFNALYSHNDIFSHQRKVSSAIHALGHTIGLLHTNQTQGTFIPATPISDPGSVMHSVNSPFTGLTAGDVRAVQVLYPYPKQELYILNGQSLFAVDAATGASEKLGVPNWSGDVVMTSCLGYIVAVQGGKLWRIDPASYNVSMTSLGGGWSGTEIMTSMYDDIYTVQGGSLWQMNINGQYMKIYDGGWDGRKVTATNGYLFFVIEGTLWRDHIGNIFDPSTQAPGTTPESELVSQNTSGVTVNGELESDTTGITVNDDLEIEWDSLGTGWEDSEAITAMDGYVYIVQGGNLWKIDAASGTTAVLAVERGGTVAMTNYNGSIYSVQAGKLWRTDPATGLSIVLSSGWDQVQTMTAVQ